MSNQFIEFTVCDTSTIVDRNGQHNMKYSRTDLWVIDVLSEWGQNLSAFRGDPVDRAEHWQRGVVPDPNDILDSICRLWHDGLISWMDNEGCVSTCLPVPNRKELLSHRCIGLTDLGGAVWERWAIPEWSLYYADATPECTRLVDLGAAEGVLQIEATNIERLHQILFLGEYYWGIRFIRESGMHIEERSPYRSYHWKEHTIGYVCQIAYSVTGVTNDDVRRGMRIWRRHGFQRSDCIFVFDAATGENT